MKKLTLSSPTQAPHPDQILAVYNDFTLEVCMNDASKQVAFQIRYRANQQATGVLGAEGLIYDSSDFLPNTRIFLVWYQDKPVATLRSCAYSDRYHWLATEATERFPTEIDQQLGLEVSLLEANRFSVDPDFQGSHSLFACKLLFRAHGMNATVHQSEYIVNLVRPHHQAFYLRFFGMQVIAQGPCYLKWAQSYTNAVLLVQKTALALQTIMERGMPAFDREDILQYARCAQLPDQSSLRIAA